MFLQSQVRRNVTFSSLAFSISLAHSMIGLKSDSSTKLSCLNDKYKMVLTVIFMTILRSLHFLISIQETLISSRELKRGLYAYLGVVTTPQFHLKYVKKKQKNKKFSHSVMSFCNPMDYIQPARLLCPCNFPGKKTGMGSHSLLQWIFLSQGSNPGLLHCRFFIIGAIIDTF